jgi:3alpha(or 20beta)-hydroxysteroid dehydrogenase
VNEFQEHVAIVTGAARGVGEAIATRLARGGAHVIVADLLEEQGEAVAKAVGGRFCKLDVSDATAWERIVDEVVA